MEENLFFLFHEQLRVLSLRSTLVLSVKLVEGLRVDEAHSSHGFLLGQQVSLAVPQFLIGHQGVVAVAHSHVRLQVGQLLSHLCLLSLQEFWQNKQKKCGITVFFSHTSQKWVIKEKR